MQLGLCRLLMHVTLVIEFFIAAGQATAQQKAPVPDGAALEASQKAAGELYGDRFRSAKTLADKTAVATDMIEAALQLQGGSPDQYVLLKIAREIAAGAGDAATALQAAEKQAERFDVSAAKLRAETLLTAAREAATTAQHKAVAETALPVVGSLTDENEIELAVDVCEAGRAAASKSRQFALVKELAAKVDDLKKQQASSAEYRRALAVMENDPAEPAANLAAGRYLCLVKGDWVKGVPMLALGSDAALKAVALMELRGADSAEQQAAIGNAWWDAAETRPGGERDTLRLRAGFWYRQAEPKLAGGLAGLKIKQRLAEISKLGREIPTASRGPAGSQSPPLAIAPFDEKSAKQHQAAWAKHLKVPVLWTNTIGMRFVLIPPGEFDMGSTAEEVARLLGEAKEKSLPSWYIDQLPSEGPKHRVRITKPFYLGISEVTQAEYERVMGSNPSKFKGDPTRPVEMVNWDEASAFCRKLGVLPQARRTAAGADGPSAYRLPTEAEWEYACRAGTATAWYGTEDEAALKEHAWFGPNAGGTTHPSRQKTPNAWSLYGMHGNVSEWCHDWWANDYYGMSPVQDPSGPATSSRRVYRGGGWGIDDASYCRASYRGWSVPRFRDGGLGFRLVSVLAGTPGK